MLCKKSFFMGYLLSIKIIFGLGSRQMSVKIDKITVL